MYARVMSVTVRFVYLTMQTPPIEKCHFKQAVDDFEAVPAPLRH